MIIMSNDYMLVQQAGSLSENATVNTNGTTNVNQAVNANENENANINANENQNPNQNKYENTSTSTSTSLSLIPSTSTSADSRLTVSGAKSVMSERASSFYTLDLRESVSSTNTLVKEAVGEFQGEGLVIAASHQSAGRGRLGRTFHSPMGSGLYFSVLLRPQTDIENAVFITTTAAVAMCQAVKAAFDVDLQIKWVNDLYKGTKKVCGILTEGVLSSDASSLCAVVLGIGVNICPPRQGFPEDIACIADAVLDASTDSNGREYASVLLGTFLDRFLTLYKDTSREEIARLYRSMNLTVGKSIRVIYSGSDKPRDAVALDIDGKCRLKVQYTDTQETEYLSSGEISIRHTEPEND